MNGLHSVGLNPKTLRHESSALTASTSKLLPFIQVLLQFCSFIPLRAKQVSEANLRSEQGGINFTPFVLSLQYAKKKKKKISHMDGGQLKNVCLSVCCLSVVCLLSVCL